MYARVSTWEGTEAGAMREMTEMVQSSDGPPPGVPSVGITVLYDEGSKRAIVIGLFETEEDLRKGDEALKAMDPPSGEAMGRHTSTDMYEVAVERRLSGAASS
jgi:hypothetical protein